MKPIHFDIRPRRHSSLGRHAREGYRAGHRRRGVSPRQRRHPARQVRRRVRVAPSPVQFQYGRELPPNTGVRVQPGPLEVEAASTAEGKGRPGRTGGPHKDRRSGRRRDCAPTRARAGRLFFESSSRSSFLSEHDLFRKPLHTFRDHAFNAPTERAVPMRSSGCGAWPRPEAFRAGGYGNRRP